MKSVGIHCQKTNDRHIRSLLRLVIVAQQNRHVFSSNFDLFSASDWIREYDKLAIDAFYEGGRPIQRKGSEEGKERERMKRKALVPKKSMKPIWKIIHTTEAWFTCLTFRTIKNVSLIHKTTNVSFIHKTTCTSKRYRDTLGGGGVKCQGCMVFVRFWRIWKSIRDASGRGPQTN